VRLRATWTRRKEWAAFLIVVLSDENEELSVFLSYKNRMKSRFEIWIRVTRRNIVVEIIHVRYV
jgi:hypothetical protein